MTAMTVGSLFSGVGGFDLGFEQAGYTVAWQVEADEKARRVLRHRWPSVPIHDDVRTVGAHNLTPVDVLVGGFPCQDLSVAGKRAGLTGARSGLFYELMRIARELAAPWVVLENVPGLLTSQRGADFGAVLAEMVECGYGVAWRVLDSRYFGVAQRRRRVFLVGCLGGDTERARTVLFEPEGGSRHPSPGGEARARVAGASAAGARGAGAVAYTLRSAPGGVGQGHNTNYVMTCDTYNQSTGDTVQTLRDPHGTCGDAIPAIAFDNREAAHDSVAMTLRADCHAAQPMVFQDVAATLKQRGRGYTDEEMDNLQVAHALSASMGHHGHSSPRGDGSDNLVTGALSRADGFMALPSAYGVRRLTPLECERLQGFPDGWTCLCDAKGVTSQCVCPDSPRYKQMGNAVTVDVIRWIAERLLAVLMRRVA